jgi:hypothetical protein
VLAAPIPLIPAAAWWHRFRQMHNSHLKHGTQAWRKHPRLHNSLLHQLLLAMRVHMAVPRHSSRI